jgi:polyferredoxin
MKKIKIKQRRSKILRLLLLGIVLLFSTAAGIFHQYALGWAAPNVDAFCPFGGIESAFSIVFTGTLLNRIAISSFVLLVATIILAIIFRRTFCGHLCAFGALQELFARLGKKLIKRQFKIPIYMDKPLRILKYLVLIVFVLWTFMAGELVIRPFDPWAAYHHITSPEIFTGFLIGFIILIVSLGGSFFYDRFFCKYLCPMGAFLALLYPLGIFKVKRNEESCIHCMACDKACPVDIKVEAAETVLSHECINCNLCVNSCPVENTLYVEGPKKARVSPNFIMFFSIIVFALVIGLATIAGGFDWEIPGITETTKQVSSFNPDNIRGTDTFKAVSEASGISKDLLMQHFKLTGEEYEKPIRDKAHKAGFETEDVREFIKEQLAGK